MKTEGGSHRIESQEAPLALSKVKKVILERAKRKRGL